MSAVRLDDEVMTLEEVAAFLKIGEATIYTLTRDSTLPARKVGREWRYLKSEVLAYLKEARVEQEGVIQQDSFGGEYKTEAGETKVALWLPITLEEKEAQIEKALAEKTTVSELVTKYLRSWLKSQNV